MAAPRIRRTVDSLTTSLFASVACRRLCGIGTLPGTSPVHNLPDKQKGVNEGGASMPALSGLRVAALGLLAAIVVYFLAWRATAHRSIGTQALVRGGLFVLLAVPLAAGFFVC